MESQPPQGVELPSAQQQLDALAADREALRTRARYPFWYFALWALACSWWALIAFVPEDERLWLGLFPWVLFAALFYAHARRRVRVPPAPRKWPNRREWLLLTPAFLAFNACWYIIIRYDEVWLVTAAGGACAVLLAVFGYRSQRIVFRDER